MSRGKHRKMAATFTHRRLLPERVYLQWAVAAANSMIEGFRRIQAILGPLALDPQRPSCKPRKARRIRRRRAKARGSLVYGSPWALWAGPTVGRSATYGGYLIEGGVCHAHIR